MGVQDQHIREKVLCLLHCCRKKALLDDIQEVCICPMDKLWLVDLNQRDCNCASVPILTTLTEMVCNDEYPAHTKRSICEQLTCSK